MYNGVTDLIVERQDVLHLDVTETALRRRQVRQRVARERLAVVLLDAVKQVVDDVCQSITHAPP